MRLALTKRTGDAIRMLLYLAELPEGERRTSSELAEACQVSHGNAPTLIAALSRADLLSCVPGRGGGCTLSRHPSEITIADAITALEGSLEPERCTIDNRPCADRDYPCGLHQTWSAALQDLTARLVGLSLADAQTRGEALRTSAGY